ncbi:MAG: 2Fe-2S iron-sulfur cluster binding domain-containing protein [Phycisphaerae bacterium]|nr:2Fe-2S iron-sulfur cluster binding domain-containing protein [Phycisphaerae bacterium]
MHVDPIDPATAKLRVRVLMEDPESLGQSAPEATAFANPGMSLLEVALANGINIEHACGGVCACSTCHVYVEQGERALSEPTEAEEDRVEEAPGLQRNSRLSCQCVIQPSAASTPITIRVPSWNRNAVKEIPH